MHEPRPRASFSIPVKSVSFKSFDYRRHRTCAIARLVSQLRHINFIQNASRDNPKVKGTSWCQKVLDNVKVTLWHQKYIKHMSWREKVCHDIRNTSWHQKYGIHSKLHMHVTASKSSSWRKQVHHRIKNTSWHKKIRRDNKKLKNTSSVDKYVRKWRHEVKVTSKVHYDIKKYITTSKLHYDIKITSWSQMYIMM